MLLSDHEEGGVLGKKGQTHPVTPPEYTETIDWRVHCSSRRKETVSVDWLIGGVVDKEKIFILLCALVTKLPKQRFFCLILFIQRLARAGTHVVDE